MKQLFVLVFGISLMKRKLSGLPMFLMLVRRNTLTCFSVHVGFGLVLGEDGMRVQTRSSEVIRLVDLIDEAKSCSKTALIERGKAEERTEEELEQTAEAVGYGAVKYAYLKNNGLTNYTFNFDQMLNDKTGSLVLDYMDKRALGLHLLQFSEVIKEACANLLPNILCEYLYNLSKYFAKFYSHCQVVGSAEETSRLLLQETTATVMRKCFHLLGIVPIDKL